MALGRLALACAGVAAWFVLWALIERRVAGTPALRSRDLRWLAGEALALTLLAALWFTSLGAGAAWLVFLLVGVLREWPIRTPARVLRIGRVVVASGLLAWILPA
ncbi:MAG TPA: hypothetical protein VMY76_16525 [Gemmatimonadales bacterium]|nr:hypothetical protein [Gemmatimonadales bacterium]